MHIVLKSNDLVLIGYAEALLREAGLGFDVFDGAMSVMEGSIGILPRRLMVIDEDAAEARRILAEALGADKLEPLG